MSFNLSFVQSLITANLKVALPWAIGGSVAASAKAIFTGKVSPEVLRLAGKTFGSLALSAAINTAAAFLPNRFAVLNSPAAKHAVSAFSTLFVAYLFAPKTAKPESKPAAPVFKTKVEVTASLSKEDVKKVLEKQGIRLVEKADLEEIAEQKENRGIFVVLAWDPNEGENGALFPRFMKAENGFGKGDMSGSRPYNPETEEFTFSVKGEDGKVFFKASELKRRFEDYGYSVLRAK